MAIWPKCSIWELSEINWDFKRSNESSCPLSPPTQWASWKQWCFFAQVAKRLDIWYLAWKNLQRLRKRQDKTAEQHAIEASGSCWDVNNWSLDGDSGEHPYKEPLLATGRRGHALSLQSCWVITGLQLNPVTVSGSSLLTLQGYCRAAGNNKIVSET